MTPLHQIKRLAGTFVFNQFLYPRETLLSETAMINDEQISRYLTALYGDEKGKLDFAIEVCHKRTGKVLDLANGSHGLGLGLVKKDIETSVIDHCAGRITALRAERDRLTSREQSLFHIYPMEPSKYEIDERYQTLFASHQAMEQCESEFSILGTLRNSLAHLNPEGSFFVEVHNLDFFENQWNFREGVWSYLGDKMESKDPSRIWEKTYPGLKDSQTVFEFSCADSFSGFKFYRSTLHLFNLDQWMKLFELAGFIVEDCFGNWKKAQVSSQLPQLIFHLKAR